MTKLTPEAEELVKAGREALRPSDADRKRVFQALLPQLGGLGAAGGLNAPSTAPAAPAAASGVAVKVAAAIVAISVAGGGLFLGLRKEAPSAVPAATATAQAPSLPVLEAPIEKLPESVPTEVPRAESPEKRAPVASSRPADSLAEEVAILSDASTALHSGRPAAALKMLDEHARKFPRGALGQERTSARIQALCALGRTKQAHAELARLERAAPNSPHVARARKACGSGTTEK